VATADVEVEGVGVADGVDFADGVEVTPGVIVVSELEIII
jgi:hypothetical protein